jgi:hypothetical protein
MSEAVPYRSQVTLIPLPQDKKESKGYTHGNIDLEILAMCYNIDVIFLTAMDVKFLAPNSCDAFATLLVSYSTLQQDVPHQIPMGMYDINSQNCGGSEAPGQLPKGYQTGYTCLYEEESMNYYFTCLSKSKVRFMYERRVELRETGKLLLQEALTNQR